MNLKDYIRGQRNGKHANKLERESMDDPFLKDAIDGFDLVSGNHISTIEKLENKFASLNKRTHQRTWILVAAAVALLFVGIPALLFLPGGQETPLLTTLTEEEAPVYDSEKETLVIAETRKPETKKDQRIAPPVIGIQEQLPKQDTPVVQEEITIKEHCTDETNITNDVELNRVADAPVDPKTKRILGKIVDENGEPLVGATVNIKNSHLKTITNSEGAFKFEIPEEQKGMLVASYIGMDSREVPLKEEIGNIVMKENSLVLSEVVTTSGGSKRKKKRFADIAPDAFSASIYIPDSTFTPASDSVSDRATEPAVPVFGETEFIEYFKKNYDQTVCLNEQISVKVTFYVNEEGRISDIRIKESSCAAIEKEVERLLSGSPVWSATNRQVTLHIEI